MPRSAADLLSSPLWLLAALILLLVLGGLLAGCGADGSGRRPAAVPDTVERFGELELIAHTRSERGGDATRYAWMPTQDWSLRWRGAPLEIHTLTGLWGDKPLATRKLHAVFIVERSGAAAPDLLVLAGDPNNTGAFHRVSLPADPAAAQPEQELLCIVTGGANDVAWAPVWPREAPARPPAVSASAPAATPAATPATAPASSPSSPDAVRSAAPGAHAARWRGPGLHRLSPSKVEPALLRLGEHCYYDTQARRVLATAPPPEGLSLITAYGPTLLSPDGRRLVRLAFLKGDPTRPVLALAPLLSPPQGVTVGSVPAYHWLHPQSADWQHLPIERNRMRVPQLEAIDAAWMAHHWHWRAPSEAKADGLALAERRGFRPLPHRGWYYSGADQYSLEGIVPGGVRLLAEAVAPELGGELQPGSPRPGDLPPIPVLRVGGLEVNLSDGSFYLSSPTRLVAGDPASDPRQRQALIHRLGDAVDRQLATGRHDRLFDFSR